MKTRNQEIERLERRAAQLRQHADEFIADGEHEPARWMRLAASRLDERSADLRKKNTRQHRASPPRWSV